MGITTLPSFIAGEKIEPGPSSPRIRSLDGTIELPVAESSAAQVRRALRYADECQRRLHATPISERIEAARSVITAYARRADDAVAGLAQFRGLVARDTRWMCDVNLRWAEEFEQLVTLISGGSMSREVTAGGKPYGRLGLRSKGKACLFSSSTMDGPAAVVAVCHAMLAGTHLILRPSFRDAATHLAYECMLDLGHAHYGQLVRWRGDSPEAPSLNRLLLGNVAQAIVFSATETFRELIDGCAEPGTAEWDALHVRTQRYGTGLPLAVVTARADLPAAARDLVEGARLGGGRFCLSTGPVLVERECQQALADAVVEEARKLRSGDPLDDSTDLSSHDLESSDGLRLAVQGFGGKVAWGDIRARDMDVVVLTDVPVESAALHREVPGPVLSLIPVDSAKQAAAAAASALQRNHRAAWTALALFGSDEDFHFYQNETESYRYLRGGVVARVKLLLPHQGSYFALDLLRRVSNE